MKNIFLFVVGFIVNVGVCYAQTAQFETNGNRCVGVEIEFTDQSLGSIDSWSWDFGDTDTSSDQNPTHIYADSGTYTIRLTVSGPSGSDDIVRNIRIELNPQILFFIDTARVFYSSYSRVFLDSSKAFNPVVDYLWNLGDGNEVTIDTAIYLHKYNEPGMYTVQHSVRDNQGCISFRDTIIEIKDIFIVPNVFTPNGDDKNEQFIVTSNGVTKFSIDIYSRWGNLIFRRTGHNQIIWDGRMTNGTLVKPGTYFYVLTSESDNTEYEPQKGFVTIFY